MKGLLFTYLLTYGGSIVALLQPFYGLLVYVCFAIIKPDHLWHWSVSAGNYSRIVALAMLAGWALHGFGNWKLGRAKAALAMLVGFWVWAAVSTLACADQAVGLRFLEAKGKIVLPVVVGLSLIDSPRQLKQLAWTIALSQGYVAYDLNMSYFRGFNRLEQVGFGGMDNNSATIALVTGVGLTFFLGISAERLWARLLALGCSALMAHAVFFSFSRGAMLALVVVGLVTLLLLPKRPQLLVLFGIGVVVALLMAGPEVRERFASVLVTKEDRDSSAQSRLDMWRLCWSITLRNPLTGIGPDHFPLQAHQYGLTPRKEAHTLWLQTSAELGLPGLLFLAGYYGITALRLLADARRQGCADGRDRFVELVPSMVISSLAGFAVAAQFVSLEGLEFPYYVALLGAGALKLNSVPAREFPAAPSAL